jgi:hypothetical protein
VRIWRFTSPRSETFATAERRGTWTESETGDACPECGAARQRREKPIVLFWQTGSDVIGDFLVTGFDSDVVVMERAAAALEERFTGFERGPVEIVDDPEAAAERRGRRVPSPYSGPDLVELWIVRWVHLDQERSTAELEWRCGTCGYERWRLDGVERWDSYWDAEAKLLIPRKTTREPGAGVFVREEALEGADIFRVHEFPGWVFCTDRVRDFILEQRFTNVDFSEMGDILQ